MSDRITTPYAANVGTLVVNLANRGYLIKLQTEESVLGGHVLHLRLTSMKTHKTLSQVLTEAEVNAIEDVSVVADALVEKLRKMT